MFLLAMWRLYTVSLTLAVPAMHCLHKTKGFNMALTLKELCDQIDYLVSEVSGQSLYPQIYDEYPDSIIMEYDNGSEYESWDVTTPVEPTAQGTVLILGTEYRAYVAQQVKFDPTQE